MKEIGETLKEARENIGLSIEEVAKDLKLRPVQIENIESGNADAFKDIFYLKNLIKDYSKYLGLDYDDMVDEFNEFLFDHTSRISLDDIKKAKKKASKKEKKQNRIASPYTMERKSKFNIKYFLIFLIIALFLALGTFIIKNIDFTKEEPNTSVIGG